MTRSSWAAGGDAPALTCDCDACRLRWRLVGEVRSFVRDEGRRAVCVTVLIQALSEMIGEAVVQAPVEMRDRLAIDTAEIVRKWMAATPGELAGKRLH